jgi:glycosyltransferase involved in cell wall biosynthesis
LTRIVAVLPRVLRELFPGATGPVARPLTDIAVVVPLYNHARFIGAALRSVLAQTAAPREIVVIDDGSRDGGLDIARGMLRDVKNCRVLAQENAGAHAAINRAVALTEAPFIAVLNSDDCFASQKLAWCQEIFATAPDVDLIAGRVALIGERGEVLARGTAADWLRRAHDFAERVGLDQLALLHENFVATTSNIVFSRRLWVATGGFAALRYCHDLDFLMRAFDRGRVVLDRARVHVQYRVHERNTIGEDVRQVRVELAAVIAATLCQSGARLLPDGAAGFDAFMAFLRAKNLSDLVLYFCALFPRFESRDAFLAFATAAEDFSRFAEHLRARGC